MIENDRKEKPFDERYTRERPPPAVGPSDAALDQSRATPAESALDETGKPRRKIIRARVVGDGEA